MEDRATTNGQLGRQERANGGALPSPAEIAVGTVDGKPMPYGYGSGIQDVPLENGQFLFALCDVFDSTGDSEIGQLAQRIFRGIRLVATVSPEPGFAPRGPHPDGKSYRGENYNRSVVLALLLWAAEARRSATPATQFNSSTLGRLGDTPRWTGQNYPFRIDSRNGAAFVGEQALVTCRGGYALISIEEQRPLDELVIHRIPSQIFHGKPTVAGDRLYVSDRYTGIVTAIDISDLEKPQLVDRLELQEHPGLVVVHNGTPIIPAGYQGLLIWDKCGTD